MDNKNEEKQETTSFIIKKNSLKASELNNTLFWQLKKKMAVVMSLNVHKPFSTTELQFQNPSFNSIKYQRKNQNLHCRFFIPPKSKSYRSLIVNGLSSDSDQNTPRGLFHSYPWKCLF